MPGRLKLVLGILIFQILANAFVGFLVLEDLSDRASHGQSVSGAGLAYFAGYLSVAVAVLLVVCVVLTFRRMSWVRPAVITVQVVNIVSGVIALLSSGAIAAATGIFLAAAIIANMSRDDVRDWYVR